MHGVQQGGVEEGGGAMVWEHSKYNGWSHLTTDA